MNKECIYKSLTALFEQVVCYFNKQEQEEEAKQKESQMTPLCHADLPEDECHG